MPEALVLGTLVIVVALVVAGARGVLMESIARVVKLRRERERARATREARHPRSPRRDPGPLLELVPALSPGLHAPAHLAPIADALERSERETVELCFSVPPRHGKTTLLVHSIVWVLLRDPTAQILYASYAHGFAGKQVRKARALAIRAGLRLGEIRRGDEWTTADGGGVKAAGVGGQLAGEGFSLIIVDDPHKNRAEAESRTVRERVVTGFRDDIYTRQLPRGTSVIVCHTRWHEDDLIGQLIRPRAADDDEEGPPPFDAINLPALRASGHELVALAPRLFGVERLQRIRSRVGEYAWASLYQGSPRPRGGALFGDAVLLEQLSDDGSYAYAIGLDLARTTSTRADWNVGVVMRLDHKRRAIDVVEVVRAQGVLADRERDGAIDEGFARRLHALLSRYPGAPALMYTGRDEEQLLSLLAAHRRYPCPVRGTPALADKWLRAQSYAAGWNEGRVRVLRHAPWAPEFVGEHVAFTGLKGARDDQVDAAAAAFDYLARGIGRPEVMTLSDLGKTERERWSY